MHLTHHEHYCCRLYFTKLEFAYWPAIRFQVRAVSKRTFSSGNRMAVQTFLGAVFNLVSRWEAEDRLKDGLYRLLDSLKAPVPLRIGEAFAVVIYCTAPHVDQKSRSKWARALRFAAANKPSDESIKKFIKRKGGINACASKYAQYVRRKD
jgi:hypothetical protein